jgi:hypothetical protein
MTMKDRKIILCFLIILLIAVSPAVVFSASYYVDSSSGDDNNDGLSIATAWRTVGKVNTIMSQLPVGSDILFKRGEQFFSDSLYISISGTEADPVVIGAYGSGAKPVFISGADIVCSGQGLGHIKVQDIFFQSPGFGAAVSFAAENMHDITISRVDVRDSNQNGIFLAAVDGYLIEDCTIINCGLSGIVIYGTDEDWPPITNGIIRGNEILNMDPVHGDGITLHASDGERHGEIGANHLLENNRIGNCGENAYDLTSGSNITVRNCEGFGSNEIEVLLGADDVWIDRCYFHDGNRSGIYVASSKRATISNTIVENMAYHSLVVGDTNGQARPVIDVKLFHNTIYHSSDATVFDVCTGVDGLQFTNNIVMATGDSLLLRYLGDASPSESESNFTHNIWYRSSQSMDDFGYNGSIIQKFNFAYWQDEYGQGSNSLFTEPGWVDPAGGNYHLLKESAGIDAGINIGTVDDYEGTLRPQGTQVDMGAFEYLYPLTKSSIFLLLRGVLSNAP